MATTSPVSLSLSYRAENKRFSTLKRTKTDDTQPKLNVVCFVVQSCLTDADFVIPSNYCLISTREKTAVFTVPFFIIGQSFFKSAFLLFDDAAQAAQLPEQPIHLPFLRRLTIKTVAAATAAAKMQIITMSAILIQKGLRRCKL